MAPAAIPTTSSSPKKAARHGRNRRAGRCSFVTAFFATPQVRKLAVKVERARPAERHVDEGSRRKRFGEIDRPVDTGCLAHRARRRNGGRTQRGRDRIGPAQECGAFDERSNGRPDTPLVRTSRSGALRFARTDEAARRS